MKLMFDDINKIGDAIAAERKRWDFRPSRSGGCIVIKWPPGIEPDDKIVNPVDIFTYELADEKTARHYVRNACIIAGLKAAGIECEAMP